MIGMRASREFAINTDDQTTARRGAWGTKTLAVTLDPMHDEEFTKMATDGFTSQPSKLDKRYSGVKR